MKVVCLKAWILFLSLGFLAAAMPVSAQVSLISTGSVWKYLDDGTDPGVTWTAPGFLDGSWLSGPAELGFGDGGEATTNRAGFITYYYRQTFNVPNAGSITNLRARIKRDDGAVAYLNGVEVFRDNMPAGAIGNQTLAAATAADDGQNFWAHSIAASALVAGDNVFAVEVHQSATTSSDISFDMELIGNPQPVITITGPTNGQTIASSAVNISGTAIPGGSNITSIQVFQGATLLGTSTSPNWSVVWPNAAPGSYAVHAVLTDSSGMVANSATINITVQTPPASMLIPRNSVWNYHNLNQDLGTAWLDLGYDDSAAHGWASATAPLGDNLEGSVQEITAFGGTVIDIGASPRYPTIYFRKTVNVSHAGGYQGLILRVMRDDEVFIYLNGQFLTNSGCSGNTSGDAPTLPFSSYCCVGQAAAAGVEEYTYWEIRVPSTLLVDGPNIFAVQGKNQASGSTDFAFDLEVEGIIDLVPPAVVSVDPPPGSTQVELRFVDVLFDDTVLGVNASDLLINSEPATNMVVINPREYTFYFPTPATGTVQIAWAPNHGITDGSASRNPFDGTSYTWTYNFNPNASRDAQVIISEFMADNNTGIRDPLDGKRVDWIELYNGGALEVNLAGWHLTDESTNLTKWTFPPVIIPGNGFLLVYATGDNEPTRYLHTNFKLDNGGEYLALVQPNGQVASAFSPTFPAQSTDVSYGRDAVDTSLVGYFTRPTPGARNSSGGSGFMEAPIFSIESGVYTNDSLSLTITGPAGGTIRYTTDGTNPTNTSPVYAGPINIPTNATVKARVYPPAGTNLFPSVVVAKTYVLLDASLRDFNSNLPILILDSHATGVIPDSVPPGGARAKGTFVVFDTIGGRTTLRQTPQLQAPAEFERFGQTSVSIWGPNAKMPYNIEIQDASGNDEEHSILGLPADADWKLRPAWEKTVMNDLLAFELFEQMGHYSVRRKHVEVFVHQGSGKLTAADYGGIEVLLEKIEIAGNRTDLQKLTTAMTNEPDISGGYIFKKDKDSGGDLNFTVNSAAGVAAQALKFHDPKPRELIGTPAGTNQQRYLVGFLNAMVKALGAANFATATGTNHYSYYMDVDAFVDQFWIVEFPKQIDGYRLSDYFSKDRNGKLKPGPIWDWNLSFGNANYADCGHAANWYWNLGTDWPWAKRLLTGGGDTGVGGDPDFCQKVADRWAVLRTNVMNGYRVTARIDEIAAQLTEAATRPAPLGDFTKPAYARLGIYQWPEPNGAAGGWDVDYQNDPTYPAVIADMKRYVITRYNWIDSLFLPPPTFSQPDGMVTNGTTITLSVTPGATNYYTLDGTDPRAPGGNVSAGASMYLGPITINANARLFVRSRMANSGSATARPFQNTWSGPSVATFFTTVAPLRITEIMYNPAALVGSTNNNDNFEYIEVQNIGGTPLNVNRFSLGGGVQFQFPNAVLTNGEYAVIVKDINAFQLRYGTNTVRILGTYTGNLANSGDHVVLSGPVQEPIQDFSYQENWYPATDGAGFSLVLTDPNAPPGVATSWRPSTAVGGSPGLADPAPPARPRIVVNEVRSYADPLPDAIELYNPTASAVDIGGWFLSDDFDKPKKYTFGPGTIIAGNGYRTFTESDFNSNTNDPNSFALGSKGDSVWLFSGNGIDLTGYAHGFDFGAAEFGVDFGRYVDSTGDDHFVAQAANTLGNTNSLPKVGPVVISEIMYHPADIAVGTNGFDNTIDEYIELQNISGSPVNLYDPSYPANTWHLRDAIEFDFPTNVSIAANGFALVVSFDPVAYPNTLASFRANNFVPADVPVYGPWIGKLGNDSERLELRKPRTPDTNGEVPYVLVERISYQDRAPWSPGADGIGLSLQRIVPASYGNEPTNWVAAAPSPAANYVPGTPPSITSQPGDQLIFAGSNVTFTVTATGPAPLRYQWRYMGQNLRGATGPTLSFTNFQVSQAGLYNILVLNSGGYALGTNFSITSRVKTGITSQPVDRNVLVGATTNFTISGVGTGPLRYQWFFNGVAITTNVNPTATTPNLVITNIQSASEGLYYCRFNDDYETLNSTVAHLSVVARPSYAVPPASTTIVEGGTAVFTVAAGGTAPMFFNWRTNGFAFSNGLPNAIVIRNATNSILILTNVSLSFSNYAISATITNIAGSAPSPFPFGRLFVLPDSDHDGLPDSFEATHTGDANDGAFDSDGDTMSNAAEYIAGTDSLDSASNLKVQTIGPGIGRLQFTAVSNRTYTVQYTDKLNPPTWNKLADVLARNVTRTEAITDPNATTNRFYRLVIPIQP